MVPLKNGYNEPKRVTGESIEESPTYRRVTESSSMVNLSENDMKKKFLMLLVAVVLIISTGSQLLAQDDMTTFEAKIYWQNELKKDDNIISLTLQLTNGTGSEVYSTTDMVVDHVFKNISCWRGALIVPRRATHWRVRLNRRESDSHFDSYLITDPDRINLLFYNELDSDFSEL